MTVQIYARPQSRVSASLLERWRRIPVAVAVDLDAGIRLIDTSIRSLLPAADHPQILGQVFTAQCDAPDFGAVVYSLDTLQSGDVLIIAADGHPDHAMIGDVLSGLLRAKGVAAIVCDGAVRDTAILGTWTDFPVYCRSVTARGPTGKEHGKVNCPVTVGTTLIEPGDWILADADGIAVLSADELTRWIDAAEARLVLEEQWIGRLTAGATAASVFEVSVPAPQDPLQTT